MELINFGKNINILRRERGMSQKEFAEFLGIPQPTVSAYENGRIAPTVGVLVSIAEKCSVSLDWLFGLPTSGSRINTTGDIADFFYQLMEVNEIEGEIDVNDKLPNDMETETDKWYARITFYGNDKKHLHNSSVCKILREVEDNYDDIKSCMITKSMYDIAKERTTSYYNAPLSREVFEEYSRDELLEKRREHLNKETDKK